MPTYAFNCQRCGPFERQMAMKDAQDTCICPFCGEVARRTYGVPNVLKTAGRSTSVRVVEPHNGTNSTVNTERQRQANGSRPGRPWMVGH
ncbi:FmdB family zinc ribbon protein [Kyrpidia spormannii]